MTAGPRDDRARSLNGGVVVEHEDWDVLLPRERNDLITLAPAAQWDVFKTSYRLNSEGMTRALERLSGDAARVRDQRHVRPVRSGGTGV